MSGGLERRKLAVLALGAVGLAAALTLAALAAPERAAERAAAYAPAAADHVVAKVPRRDASELAARRAFAAAPDSLELAAELARADLRRFRRLGEPSYLGHAQATLARWWDAPEPPAIVLLVRALVYQARHELEPARADLDRVIARAPDDLDAHLARAVVATATGDHAAARASCEAVAARAGELVAAACDAPLDALAGEHDAARARLEAALARPSEEPAVRGWALAQLAELAVQRGDAAAAEAHLRDALALDADDAHARARLADVLLDGGRAADASRLLAGRETADALLVRRAIAEHVVGGRDAARLAGVIRERAAAGRSPPPYEAARFAFVVDGDTPRALALARAAWAARRDLAGARLLAQLAAAAGDRAAAAPVEAWVRETGAADAAIARALARLAEGAPRGAP